MLNTYTAKPGDKFRDDRHVYTVRRVFPAGSMGTRESAGPTILGSISLGGYVRTIDASTDGITWIEPLE